jgi:DNA polymerase elongation subunit (family B)
MNYKIIQDTEGIYEQGFYLVVDTDVDKFIDIFEFKSEAKEYLMEIKKNGVENVDSSIYNGQKNKYA